MLTQTFTSDDARKRWRDLIDLAYIDQTEVVIERYNKPVAVLVNYENYQTMKALLSELARDQPSGKKPTGMAQNSRTWEAIHPTTARTRC